MPGSPLDALSAGTNNLLKQGESLVTGAADIVDALAPIMGRPPTPRDDLASEDEGMPCLPDIGESERERIVGALEPEPGGRNCNCALCATTLKPSRKDILCGFFSGHFFHRLDGFRPYLTQPLIPKPRHSSGTNQSLNSPIV